MILNTCPKLYLLTNEDPLPLLLDKLTRALASGAVDVLQIRRKHAIADIRSEIEAILVLCQDYDVKVVINDSVALAQEFGVGVHLGQGDGDVMEARRLLGDKALIGRTCHNDLGLVEIAKKEGTSYAALGAVFVSGTKPNAVQVSLETIQNAIAQGGDVCLIGGITLDNINILQDSLYGYPQYVAVTADIMAQPLGRVTQHCQLWGDRLKAWH